MKRLKKKRITIHVGILLLASILVYPIFAKDEIKEEITIQNNEISQVKEMDVKGIDVESRAVVGTEFNAKIYNNGVQNLDCKFKILTVPGNGKPGTVQTGEKCIDNTTQGTIAFPEVVSFENEKYIITTIGEFSFVDCTGITSTGLENNSTITTIGAYAFSKCIGLISTGLGANDTVTSIGGNVFSECSRLTTTGLETNRKLTYIGNQDFANCTGLKSTGLETNTKITSIGSSAFSGCSSLKSTGLERNNSAISIGQSAFSNCTGLISTGLERNTTLKSIDAFTFLGCTSLEDIIFEITVLPTMGMEVFNSTGVNIYYLAGTENLDELNDVGANDVKQTYLTGIQVQSAPIKVNYIEGQIFDPTGLVIAQTFTDGIGENIIYSDSTKDAFDFDKSELSVGDTKLTITYNNMSVEQIVTVNKKSIAGISITSKPTKVTYIEGQEFNPTGLVITVNYDNGMSENIIYNDKTKMNFSFKTVNKKDEYMPLLKLGDTTIEVGYRGEIATLLTIDVIEKEITEIQVKTSPTKREYIEGEELNLKGLILEVSYNNGIKEEVVYEESTKDMFIYSTNKLGTSDTKVIVGYQGKEIEIEIKVNIKPEIDVLEPEVIETVEKIPALKEKIIDTSDSTGLIKYIGLVGMSLFGLGYMVIKRKS